MADDANMKALFNRLSVEGKALEEKLKETDRVLQAIDEKMADFQRRQAIRMEADKNITAETTRRMNTNER